MEEPRYSNRQIERLLDQQTEVLKEFFKQELAPVIVQTTKTNGRVTKLEEKSVSTDKYVWLAVIIVSALWALLLALVSAGKISIFHL